MPRHLTLRHKDLMREMRRYPRHLALAKQEQITHHGLLLRNRESHLKAN